MNIVEGAEALTALTPRQVSEHAPRVLIVGDGVLDGWWHGGSTRLCREAPAPVVEVTSRLEAPGGAANTALNAARLGATVTFLGVVGDDADGQRLRQLLTDGGVDVSGVVVAQGARTPAKNRVMVDDTVLARIDEPRPEWGEDALAQLAGRLEEAVPRQEAVIVCDYGLGALEGEVAQALLRALGGAADGTADRAEACSAETPSAAEERPLVVVDAHEPGRWSGLGPDLVTPNQQEAVSMLGVPLQGERVEFMRAHRDALLQASGARCVVVTLDKDGSLALPAPGFPLGRTSTGARSDGTEIPEHRTWARPVPEKLASGAGDTFVAALTLGCASGLSAPAALDLAQAAADVAVHCPGTAVCTTADLTAYLDGLSSSVLDTAALREQVQLHRAEGRRIVLTNGCFDVLHRGHTRYLEQARQLGDVLVVGINDDESVRRLKGEGRPINSAPDRAAVLAALSSVDHVAVFSEDTATELVQAVQPDVYAKGGDYSPEMLTETPTVRAHGGEVVILDYVPDHSTSGIVRRIRSMDHGDRPGVGPATERR